MRHPSIGAGAVSFRADLPEVLAEVAARDELARANAWKDNANLLLAPALGLPTLPVVRFTDPAPDEVGSRYTALPGSCRASRVPRPIGRLPGSTTTFTATPTRGQQRGGSLPSCSRPTPAVGSSTGRSARCSRLRAALSAGGRKPAEGLAERTPAVGLSTRTPAAKFKASPTAAARDEEPDPRRPLRVSSLFWSYPARTSTGPRTRDGSLPTFSRPAPNHRPAASTTRPAPQATTRSAHRSLRSTAGATLHVLSGQLQEHRSAWDDLRASRSRRSHARFFRRLRSLAAAPGDAR